MSELQELKTRSNHVYRDVSVSGEEAMTLERVARLLNGLTDSTNIASPFSMWADDLLMIAARWHGSGLS